jgi:hypothetical protein
MTFQRTVAAAILLLLSGAACGARTPVVPTNAATLAAIQAGKLKIRFVRIKPAVPVAK